MAGRTRRAFTPQFKAETVAFIRSHPEKSLAQGCQELHLSRTAVARWVEQAEIDSGQRDGLTTAEREELRRLRREVKTLQQERDILRKAAAFFAKETL